MVRTTLSAAALLLALGASIPASAQTAFTGTLLPNALGNVGNLLGSNALSPALLESGFGTLISLSPIGSPVPFPGFPGAGSSQLPGLDVLPGLDPTLFTVARSLNGGARPVTNDANLQSGIRTFNGAAAFPDINGTFGSFTNGGLLKNGLLGLAGASPVPLPVPGAPSTPGAPSVPGVPAIPGAPALPDPTSLLDLSLLPTDPTGLTSLLDLSLLPTAPGVPAVPGVPALPDPTALPIPGGVPALPVPGVPTLPLPI